MVSGGSCVTTKWKLRLRYQIQICHLCHACLKYHRHSRWTLHNLLRHVHTCTKVCFSSVNKPENSASHIISLLYILSYLISCLPKGFFLCLIVPLITKHIHPPSPRKNATCEPNVLRILLKIWGWDIRSNEVMIFPSIHSSYSRGKNVVWPLWKKSWVVMPCHAYHRSLISSSIWFFFPSRHWPSGLQLGIGYDFQGPENLVPCFVISEAWVVEELCF